jgi:hypothetical protein
MKFVQAINALNSQVWAFVAMLLGAFFVFKGQHEVGTNLLMGAFALFKTTSEAKTTVASSPNSDIKVS